MGTGDSGFGNREYGNESESNDVVSERRAEFLPSNPQSQIPIPRSSPQPQIPSPQPTPKPQSLIPRVSDGVIYRVLNNLLILDGERLSYRSLDVEQIGSVYEAIMGFEVKVATGRSIAIKPTKKHGAPATINLEELLATEKSKRAAWLSEQSDQDLTGKSLESLKSAATIEELLAALGNKIASEVTRNVAAAGAMIFQPSDERRRSGSHYTPRSLTEPIVRTTLEPILKQLYDPESPIPTPYSPTKEDKKRYTQGELDARIRLSERAIEHARRAREVGTPHPSQLLDLKVCDPAMGSGAFLVETCRQLGDELVKAWYAHYKDDSGSEGFPDIPPDEDELLYARRQIAQRCLYGVDKNVMAVDLAKLSLWLVTLAKDHAFTFLDHSLRAGDSLVGLTREQIIGFHWEPKKQKKFGEDLIQKRLDKATSARAKILNAREDVAYRDQQQEMKVADDSLDLIRLVGNACVSCFFAADKTKAREEELERVFDLASSYISSLPDNYPKLRAPIDFQSRAGLQTAADRLKAGPNRVPCFHWEIEFPEVFSRENGGFDAFVGNPPFLGGTRVSTVSGMSYFDWLKGCHPPAGHLCDLVAHFFRRCYSMLRINTSLGFIATNTIAQGDTRQGGLSAILNNGGVIYAANRRLRWPGAAAVIVSRVNIFKGHYQGVVVLDDRIVTRISAFLVEGKVDKNPEKLNATPFYSAGSKIYGQGFLFDDSDDKASPISEMQRILDNNPKESIRIYPYIGGEEVNGDPNFGYRRYAIFLSDIETELELDIFPQLRDIVHARVKPERDKLGTNPNNVPLKKRWWAYQAHRPELYTRIRVRDRVLVNSQVSGHLAFAFLPTDWIYAHTLNLFDVDSFAEFGLLQCRIHECWARFFASSMKDDMRYTPSDCFRTFPFPNLISNGEVETASSEYYRKRSEIMREGAQGLTKTYNRFHDPYESSSDILELRELHSAMDVAVLRAYGWNTLAETYHCEFLLDYEEEEVEGVTAQVGKKKPWRLRWPDDFRDEVLARLLELNEQRHKEELLAAGAPSAPKKVPKASTKKKAKNPTSADQLQLGLEDE
jgi:hypothetical protein